MKKPKKQNKKKQPEELTEEELKRALVDAGFTFVIESKRPAFGKPEKDLHQGETLIFPEGSTRGIPVKGR
jgi:hypothetical protein